MAKLYDMAKMTVSGTPGTGTITLASAASGFQDFATAGVQDADVVSYSILDGSAWEVGRGTYTSSGTTLSRGALFSSAGVATPISATSAALVAVSALSEDIVPGYDYVNKTLTFGGATVTTSNPILNLSQTWNAAGVAFTGLLFSVTNTASATGSFLFDFQYDAESYFSFEPNINYLKIGVGTGNPILRFGQTGTYENALFFGAPSTTGFSATAGGFFGWYSADVGQTAVASVTTRLYRDADYIVAQRNGTNAQTLRVYNTYTDASNYERGVFDWTTTANTLTIGAQATGTGALRPIDFVGSSLKFTAGNPLFYLNFTDATSYASVNVQFSGTSVAAFEYVGSTSAITNRRNGFGLTNTQGPIQFLPETGSNVLGNFTSTALSLASGLVFRWTTSTTDATTTSDTGLARNAAGILEINNGTAGTLTGCYLHWGGQARVTSDFSVTSSTTLTNITGLSVNVAAGRTYSFSATIPTTSASAGGIKFAVSGTATATSIWYEGIATDGTTTTLHTRASALDTTIVSGTGVTAAIVGISGTITVNAAGTLTIQMAQNTSNGTATVALRGSFFIVHDMP